MDSCLQSTHILMNHLYEKADEIEAVLMSENWDYERGDYTNHFIKIDGKTVLQHYFIPVFTVKGKGDMGVNLDGIFFECLCSKDSVSFVFLQKLLEKFPFVEIYGFNDCLIDFYKKGDSLADVIQKIKPSTEEKIQFSVLYPLDESSAVIVKSFKEFSDDI